MPHLVILYTANLDAPAEQGGLDMNQLCRRLADVMLAQRDEFGAPVFPVGGVRVLAYPAPRYALADGGAAGRAAGVPAEYAFVYLNLRMARGRSNSVQQTVGRALEQTCKSFFADQFSFRPIGVTLQVDEGPEIFDAKNSSLHPLFRKT